MASPNSELARNILLEYYALLDIDRDKATQRYLRPTSHFGSGNGAGLTTVGNANILEMLSGYPATKHTIETVYAVPSVGTNLLVLVTGQVQFGTGAPRKFTEAFELVKEKEEEKEVYWVLGAIVTIL